MDPSEGLNKGDANLSTSWGKSRPLLTDCSKACCFIYDKVLSYFRPILFGCCLPCCNVHDGQWGDADGLNNTYQATCEMVKRWSLSPVQGTGRSPVPGYGPNINPFLIKYISSDEESADPCGDSVLDITVTWMYHF